MCYDMHMSNEKGAATMAASRVSYGPPYNNFYGDKYDDLPTVKDVAASVRKDLNALTKDKTSPLYGAKVSVRYRSFTGGSAIDTNITSPDHVVHVWNSYDDKSADTVCTICNVQLIVARQDSGFTRYWLTPKGRAIYDLAKGMLNAHNHDRSDVMTDYFDVRFYGEVGIDNERKVTA